MQSSSPLVLDKYVAKWGLMTQWKSNVWNLTKLGICSVKVGRNTLESHQIFLSVRQVARKCRGLPLALIIIGKNMASKRTVQEWDEAIDTLASSAEFPVPTVENWTSVRRMSLMDNEIKKISDTPKCPELTTLLFQKNRMRNISGEFFKYMPTTAVVTEVEKANISEFGVTQLESISGISNLSSLRTLRLAHSKCRRSRRNEGTAALRTFRSGDLDIGSFGCRSIVKCYCYQSRMHSRDTINFIREKDVLTIPNMAVLSTLDMYSEMVEINIERRTSSLNKMPTTSGFPNLSQ
ncbi:unnamed protein product [Microthlaspi erraticum]|uniref:Uncharacterized protein n=1 Tax=Microthlaspi erraticum TaxID=1685480 RepID=A0A6D2IMD5_9BRAS|nr:unnamed protein product [Microthlaspi erraticum]